MRILAIFVSIICFITASYAESFSQYNSASRTAIVLYTPDAQGFYHKQTNVSVSNVDNIEAQYAFDKKNKKLYVATSYGNYVIKLTESKAKLVKKDKSIPQVKDKNIEALVVSVNNSLDEKFAQYNLDRERFITDSIEYAKEQKYIDVYWRVTNSVGDVRKTGHFKGTGQLEQYESASWNWDYSSYYVAGDASNMEITKVIITYMNGSQQVLTGKQIKFD